MKSDCFGVIWTGIFIFSSIEILHWDKLATPKSGGDNLPDKRGYCDNVPKKEDERKRCKNISAAPNALKIDHIYYLFVLKLEMRLIG
jgi:hypothetical protein